MDSELNGNHKMAYTRERNVTSRQYLIVYRNIRLTSNTQDVLRASAVETSWWAIPNLVCKHRTIQRNPNRI
jgi:hypothetical protein